MKAEGEVPYGFPLSRRAERWTRFGFYASGPMLAVTVGWLVWRVAEDAHTVHVVFAASQVVVWVCTLVNTRTVLRRNRAILREDERSALPETEPPRTG